MENAHDIYQWIAREPTITKKKIKENTNLSETTVKRSIKYLESAGIVKKGYNGKRTGWSILKDFCIDENALKLSLSIKN